MKRSLHSLLWMCFLEANIQEPNWSQWSGCCVDCWNRESLLKRLKWVTICPLKSFFPVWNKSRMAGSSLPWKYHSSLIGSSKEMKRLNTKDSCPFSHKLLRHEISLNSVHKCFYVILASGKLPSEYNVNRHRHRLWSPAAECEATLSKVLS